MKTTKTIKEWFEELPEPYKTQALDELTPRKSREIARSLSHAVVCGFAFQHTLHGHKYWQEFYNKLAKAAYNETKI